MVEREARRQLDSRLKAVGLSRKVSYTSSEVKAVLDLSNGTFFRMINRYAVDPDTGTVIDPLSLKAINDKGWRVAYNEMVGYLARKSAMERRRDAPLAVSPPSDIDGLHVAAAPCPYCGGRNTGPVHGQGGTQAAFRCQSCGATGPIVDNWTDALAGWNRRMG